MHTVDGVDGGSVPRRQFLRQSAQGGIALSAALAGSPLRAPLPGRRERPAQAQPISLRHDGTVLVQGQPFFPFGYYFIGNFIGSEYNSADARLRQRVDALRAMAAGGFNLMYAVADRGDTEYFGLLLDEAQRRGMYMLCAPSSAQYDPTADEMLAFIAAFRDKPAVLGWAIADDAGLHNAPDAISSVDAAVKAFDPGHPTYLSAVGEPYLVSFAAGADLLGCQAFYVRDDRRSWADPLQYIEPEFIQATATAAAYHRPVIANLQAFTWKGERGPGSDPRARWPTGAEMYNMTYQALLAGARGIIYYTYRDVHTNVRTRPDIWRATTSLAAEIKSLLPAIFDGVRVSFDATARPAGGRKAGPGPNTVHVYAGGWIYQGRAYLVVLNTSHTRTVQVTVPLPGALSGPAVPLFPHRPHGMMHRNGYLSGMLRPSDVHVYVLVAK